MLERRDKLVLAIDFGSSLTKAIGARVKENERIGRTTAFGMETEVIELPRELLNVGTQALPLNRAWVGVGDKTIAVGFLARCLTMPNPMLRQPKVDAARAKILAAIWVMKEQLKLENNLKISLCCLLPPGEYQDREKLELELSQIEEFDTPSGSIKISFALILCKVEGEGILMRHSALRGKQLDSSVIALVMMGFRNASTIAVARHNVLSKASSELGFAKLVKLVVEQTSGMTLERLTPVVAGYLETGQDSLLSQLFFSSNSGERESLKIALDLAKLQYLAELSNWFKEFLSPLAHEIVLCGGTADTLKMDIFRLLEGRSIYLHANVELPEYISVLNCGNRFSDLWCIWDYFCQKIQPKRTKVGRMA